jgi:type IV secretory pathway VirB10-like protein
LEQDLNFAMRGAILMERNVRHVQRWLDRCLEAYRHRRHGAALAELESARAELEIAREKLVEELAGRGRVRECPSGQLCRIGLTAVILLLALALPTARLSDSVNTPPPFLALRPEGPSLEVVTEEERLLLENLRKKPALAESPPSDLKEAARENPPLTARAEKAIPAPVQEETSPPLLRESNPAEAASSKPSTPDSDTLDGKVPSPSVEEVLSLLQAGQRALQPSGKGIPIQP